MVGRTEQTVCGVETCVARGLAGCAARKGGVVVEADRAVASVAKAGSGHFDSVDIDIVEVGDLGSSEGEQKGAVAKITGETVEVEINNFQPKEAHFSYKGLPKEGSVDSEVIAKLPGPRTSICGQCLVGHQGHVLDAIVDKQEVNSETLEVGRVVTELKRDLVVPR